MKRVRTTKSLDPILLITIVSEYFNLKPEKIFEKTRIRELVRIRQMVQYFLVQNTTLNYSDIGGISKKYGRSSKHDHASIVHSIKVVENDLLKDRDFLALKLKIEGSPMLDTSSYTVSQMALMIDDLINENNYLKEKKFDRSKYASNLSVKEKEILKLFKELNSEKQDEAIFKVDVMLRVDNKLNKVA